MIRKITGRRMRPKSALSVGSRVRRQVKRTGSCCFGALSKLASTKRNTGKMAGKTGLQS